MPRRGMLLVAAVFLLARAAELAACGNGAEKVQTMEALSGPIVFRGWVVSGPTQGECVPPDRGRWCLWGIEVQIDRVIKMEQDDVNLHRYKRQEVVGFVLVSPGVPDLAAGDYVEVSGREGMFNPCLSRPGWLCDAFAFLVCPECMPGDYILGPAHSPSVAPAPRLARQGPSAAMYTTADRGRSRSGNR